MENDGSGNFVNPRTYPSPQGSACAIIHDRNNDGMLDITMVDEAADVVLLYNNDPTLGNDALGTDNGLTLYPNPFRSTIFVSGAISGPVKLELYDVQGRHLLSRQLGNSRQFDMGNLRLSEGIYIVELFHNGNSQKLKMYKK
jgi:hypothetical protein